MTVNVHAQECTNLSCARKCSLLCVSENIHGCVSECKNTYVSLSVCMSMPICLCACACASAGAGVGASVYVYVCKYVCTYVYM